MHYFCEIHRRQKQSYFGGIQKHLLSMWGGTQGTLEFKFGRNKSSNKKGTCKDTGKRKAENNADPLLSGAAALMTMGVEKAKTLSAFFASFVIGCPRQSLVAETVEMKLHMQYRQIESGIS